MPFTLLPSPFAGEGWDGGEKKENVSRETYIPTYPPHQPLDY
jgi:hypothetical protein